MNKWGYQRKHKQAKEDLVELYQKRDKIQKDFNEITKKISNLEKNKRFYKNKIVEMSKT